MIHRAFRIHRQNPLLKIKFLYFFTFPPKLCRYTLALKYCKMVDSSLTDLSRNSLHFPPATDSDIQNYITVQYEIDGLNAKRNRSLRDPPNPRIMGLMLSRSIHVLPIPFFSIHGSISNQDACGIFLRESQTFSTFLPLYKEKYHNNIFRAINWLLE